MTAKISAMMEAQRAFTVTITELVGRIDFLAKDILSGLLSHSPGELHREVHPSPHRLRLAAVLRTVNINRQTQLHILSWNVCGITHCLKRSALKGEIDTGVLPTPSIRSTIYMGDFNVRHPALGDISATPNRNGIRLEDYIRRYRLRRWDTGGATHSRGGTLDYILTHGLVTFNVRCSSVPTLFSDHLALVLQYSLQSTFPPLHHRLRINIPPKYCPTYIYYMSSFFPTFNMTSPDRLYSSLVTSTQAFYDRYVRKSHIARRPGVLLRQRGRRRRMAFPSKTTPPLRTCKSTCHPRMSSWPFNSVFSLTLGINLPAA
ncbi:hypothetical protein E2C01_041913 [Portunus trituberculatus]|uniref:Endonuclease/exonuclease/phosphatase domain-containing protein n=1 Tax=Portunus trituberculatus TaxID=210409 RepID=A0A5B7FRM9_PORTR|nr:hypothetical protein [Portunus trituberculatus]